VFAALGIMLLVRARLAWPRRGRVDPAARCFAAFCRLLVRQRVAPRGAAETPTAFAARAAAALPHAAPEIEAIAGLYLRARYEPDAGHAALDELRERVARFKRSRGVTRPR
jgi:hypothetical protein